MARNKRSKIIMGVAVMLMIVALVAAIVIDQIAKRNRENLGLSSELTRAKTYNRVEEGEEAVEGTENVKFDAFFLRDLEGNGYATGVRGTCKEIGKEDTLYMEINVQTAGYLKDAKITIDGKNLYLQTALPKDEQLANSYIGNNIKEIRFNNLTNGTQKLLTGIVRSGDYSYSSAIASAIGSNINNYSREDNKIILTGTYVEEDGTEIEIRKEVPFTMDWYGTTRANIYKTTQSQYIDSKINEAEGTINLDFTVYTEETNKKLILKANHTEGEVPELNGYAPINVVYTGTNATFNYDTTTRKFTVEKTSTVGEDGRITSSLSNTNSYSIKVTYPLEAYQTLGTEMVQIKIPVNTYYEGYNNPNTEFIAPYKSNVAKATIVASYQKYVAPIPSKPSEPSKPVEIIRPTTFEITVGKRMTNPTTRYIVSKQKPLKIYNGQSEQEKDDTYTVMWRAYVGTKAETSKIVMKETRDGQEQVTDQFIKTYATTESTDDVVSNVGIYFSGADAVLGKEGEIKVYDEDTGNLLVTFTKDNWNQYTSGNPYKYEIPIKHIRVETSDVIGKEVSLYVYSIKEIDDEAITTKYEKDKFDELKYIKSTLVGTIGTTDIKTVTHQAIYEAPMSIATIGINKDTMSTQLTEENVKLTILTQTSENNNIIKWKDGTFLIKFPTELIDVQVNNITINNTNVKIENYEVIEQDGQIFIKIVTNNITPQSYTITIDANLSPDPRKATTTRNIELYATNGEESDYYYKSADIHDVNNNLNITEQVNYGTTSISMIAPNSLLTNQTATKYDSKGSTVISPKVAEIKPIYAVVDQEEKEEAKAEIGINIRNNYATTISEIKILGKIPFEGNTYTISGKNLGSAFTTKMTNTGIEVPEELKQYATIYYSENENPNKDLTNIANNWKTAEEVENWDSIKTFLIDLGDYVMPAGKEFVFNYTVTIPNGLEFNKVSYSHHGVYFCLDTDHGKYRTQTEPNRLGFRIVEKYDLEIEKYQTGKDKLVSGATYSITEIIQKEDGTEEKGEVKTGLTNNNGTIKIINLYAKKVYEIKEIKTPDDYEKNEEVIRFISDVDEYGILTINKIQGTTREDIIVTKEEGENYKAKVEVEDEIKARLKITKKEKNTENVIPYVRYKISGYNLPETGRIFTTNKNGETNIKGLSIGKEYILEEVKADGYYLGEPVIFKIVNNEGSFSYEIITGSTLNQTITEINDIPIMEITLENEKIPTYDLEIIKVKRTTDVNVSNTETTEGTEQQVTYLQGAKFKLYKEAKEIGEFTTNETGKVTISNLYQYVEGKDENATYTLKEVLAPEGYAKVKDITFKVEENEGLKFINIDENESKYIADGNTVKLTIEDSPSFKLIKKDGETGELLSNIKFTIYNVEEGERPATNSKGEILGTKEIINGKEYYTVSTNSQGEIVADLAEGLYKAVEVEAPDKYDISNNTYYFGIGTSREGIQGVQTEWSKSVGGNNFDRITCITKTSEGGYIVGGYFNSSNIILGNNIELNSNSTYYYTGMIIKYGNDGEVEWGRTITGNQMQQITCIEETNDGGYIVGGYFSSTTIDLENGVILNNNGSYDGMIIKYDSNGNVEWGKAVGGSSRDYITCIIKTNDGGYIIGGYFSSTTIDLENGVILNNNGSYDGMIIKYTVNGNVEWGKEIGGSSDDRITCITETIDGDYVVGGHFSSSSIDLESQITLNNNGERNGMIIKYGNNGKIEWGNVVGGKKSEQITCIINAKEGGYVVGGHFSSSSLNFENGTELNNKGSSDGMIIKYGSNGEVEWGNVIGGNKDDEITSIIETSEGGYIAVGNFMSSNIRLQNKVELINYGYRDGMIVKCSKSGIIEWGSKVGGENNDQINSIIEISNRSYIVGGDFESTSIKLENGTELNNKGKSDGIIIRYNIIDKPEIKIKQGKSIGGSEEDQITCIVETQDGGYLVGGYFRSSSIDLGNGEVLNNHNTNQSQDGMIIKYGSDGNVEWEKAVGGSSHDRITCITETIDGGYIVGGYFKSETIYIENGVVLYNHRINYYDGMIIKYSESGEVEWGKVVNGTNNDYIICITKAQDGGYVVGGYFNSSSIDLGNGIVLNNRSGYNDVMIIKYNERGNIEWGKTLGGDRDDEITCIVETRDGGYAIGGYFDSSSIDLGNGVVLTNKSSSTAYSDGMIIKYSTDGKVEWGKVVGGSSYDYISCITEAKDGGYVVGGYFKSNSIDLGNGVVINSKDNNINYSDGMIIKYDEGGNLEWGKEIGGTGSDQITCITESSDRGYVLGGYFDSSSIDLGNGVVLKNKVTNGSSDGMIIKYKESGKVEGGKAIGGRSTDQIICITETEEKGYMVGGHFASNSIDLEDGVVLKNYNINQSSDGMIIKIAEEIGVPEIQELEVKNRRKEFKITTEVKEIDGIKGGEISGEKLQPYEKVKYGDNSTKEIKIVPDENYEIIEIKINGKEYQYVTNEDGTYIMPQFENVTEDKHIVVKFVMNDNKIIINKIDKETKRSISGAKFKIEQINEETENNTELYHTEVETNSQGQAITQIPFGKYSITEIEAPEGYNKIEEPIIIEFRADENHEFTIENEAKAKVIINHYKAIKNEDGSYTYTEEKLAESEKQEGKENDDYTSTPHLDLGKYELIKDENGEYIIPENATGKLEVEDTIVNYYYVEKEIPLIVHHYIEGTEEKVPLKEGTEAEDITSKGKENEEYTTEAISDELLSEQYELVEVPENAKGIYTGEEVIVTYYYKKAKRELELNKYSEDGITPLEGVKFTITQKEENTQGTEKPIYTTNSQGKIKLELEVGKYEITEIEVPEGYQLPEEATTEIEITKETEKAEIEITNTKKRGTVITHHYIEGTENKVPKEDGTVVEDEIQTGIVGEAFATKVSDEVPVYYEFVSSSEKTSGEYLEETQEVIYYYRLREYNYTVEYYYDNIKDNDKTETTKAKYKGQIEEYKDKVKEGYKLEKTENLPLTIEQDETQNIIKIYYVKRNDLKYTVNYLEKETNKVLHEPKTEENQEFEKEITSSSEIISIDGYRYDSVDKDSITIQVDETKNVINIYYVKRAEYSYTVNYLEKETNKVLHEPKTEENQEFEKVITSEDEVITIDGYNYDSVEKESITIQIDSTKNIINIYYTKRQDLKYTVNYLEKETNKVLHEAKEEGNQEFQKVITSLNEVISIDGYKYDSSDKENITIQVDETKNVINLYYTKRNDLKYTVNYLEKGTDKVLHEPKIQENQTFEAVITSSNEIITIDGYKYDSVDKESITIQVDETENVINIYYISKATKYTVNYLEEDTNNILHEAKTKDSQEDEIVTTEDEIIDIEGYEYSSCDKETITLVLNETENIINIYYIKRSDLRYTVNYLEKDTNEILHEQKIVENQVFEGIIKTSTEVIEIHGYNYDSVDKESITIQVDETKNIINIYYTKRTDIKYTVEYYYDGIKDEDETEEYTATYKETIEKYEDKIRENYVLVEEKGIPLTIEVDESKNIIQIYYVTKAQAKVQYIDKITNEIIEERTEEGYVGKEFETEAKDFEGYILVEEPEEKTVPMEEEEIVLKYYYIHVSSGVIEKHIDIDTDEILYNTTHEGNEGDEYKTEPKEFENYDFVEEKYPENAEGTMKKEVITVNYYYRKREPITITVKYIDKETKEEIEETVIIKDYEGKEYKTEQKEIEGYKFVEVEGETEGKITEEKEIIYYYQKIKELEIPGEGGDEIEKPEKPQDPTTIDKEIPSAGLTKEQIAVIVVTTMAAITGIIVTIGIKGIKLDKRH